MASPFRVFRKNVKPLLAVMVVLLMLSWVVGDSLVSYLAGNRNAGTADRREANAVAVRWDGGTLTNAQVSDLVSRRRILNEFLQRVEATGAQSAYQAGVEPRALRVQRMLGPETPEQGVERSVVQNRLFADAARAAGMRVSDEAIVTYLDELGRGNVTRDQMRDILTGMQSRDFKIPIDEMMASLREEMLGRNYINSNEFAFDTITPEQRWNDWRRVNDRVVIEAAAYPAESFLIDVKDPTDAELAAFFNQYKDFEAGPDGTMMRYFGVELPSPTPGFRIPRKIDLQYVAANYDDFLAKAEEKITDEEIKKFYEDNKDPMFIKADTGLMEDKGEKKDPAMTPETTPESKDGTEATPGDEAKPADDAEAKAAPEQEKAAPEEKPAAESDSTPAAEEGKKEDAPAEGKQSSQQRQPSNSVFRLAGFQDAEKKEAAPAEGASPSESKTEVSAEKSEPAADDPAAAPAADSAAASAAPPAGPTIPANPAAEAAPKKPVEFQPLDEVKDVIRRQLAEGKVAEQLSTLIGEISGPLDTEFQKYLGVVFDAQAEKKEPPAPPQSLVDLKALAEKHGLKHGQTGPLSLLQLRDTPVGKSGAADSGRSLLSMLFGGKELDLYQPVSTVDIDGNRYVVMKMSDTPSRVPALADVRDEVIKAWKQQKASELAMKKAEEVAKKAQEAKTPLTTFFAEDPAVKVIRTDPFAELTGGDVGVVNGQLQQQPYRLSQPNDIVAPGREFLMKVFELKDGEVTAVLNHDHTIAYVVRVAEHQPALDALRNAYLSEAATWQGQNAMGQGHAQEVASSLLSDIMLGANLKWERSPDQVEQRAGDGG